MAVQFFFLIKGVSLSHRKELKSFIELLFRKEKRKLHSLTYIFCSDNYLLKINQNYLNHNYYTDIITFDMSENKQLAGEIYISVDRVKENAKTMGVSTVNELHRVIFHGALHLCGYNDTTSSQKSEMRAKEDFYLNLFKSVSRNTVSW
jgi:probable rRNA maturation factor